MSIENLTKGERFVFEWQYRMACDFTLLLAKTIDKADSFNREKLRLGYPEEVEAMINFYQTEGWWEKVQEKENSKEATKP